jgi:hypothetical protein
MSGLDDEVKMKEVDLRACAHLSSLALETSNSLLSPLRSHFRWRGSCEMMSVQARQTKVMVLSEEDWRRNTKSMASQTRTQGAF